MIGPPRGRRRHGPPGTGTDRPRNLQSVAPPTPPSPDGPETVRPASTWGRRARDAMATRHPRLRPTATHERSPDRPQRSPIAMNLSELTLSRLRQYNPRDPALRAARAAAALRLDFEALALPDEDPAESRALVDAWVGDFPPRSVADDAMIEQAVAASIDKKRCLRARASLLAQKVRTAEFSFDRQQQDEVEAYVEMLADRPARALAGLNRSAAGARYQIGRWERLAGILQVEGTWYGHDRDEATRLQGATPGLDHLAESEAAYATHLYCLMAQPEPRPDEVRQLGDPARKPQAFHDHDPALWMPFHHQCGEQLAALAEHKLADLRAREAWLARSWRSRRGPRRGNRRGCWRGASWTCSARSGTTTGRCTRPAQALLKGRPPGEARGRAAAPGRAAPPAPRAFRPCPVASAAFFDYHSARRAVVEGVENAPPAATAEGGEV